MPKLTMERAAEIGRLGGRATVERHGREHMRAIGRRGFAATVERHFAGDRRRAVNDLIQRGLAAGDARYPEALRKWRYDPADVPDRLPPQRKPEGAPARLREARAAYCCSSPGGLSRPGPAARPLRFLTNQTGVASCQPSQA